MTNLSKVALGDLQAQTHFCMQYPTPGINSDTGIVSTEESSLPENVSFV
jgi:hypothetical protein